MGIVLAFAMVVGILMGLMLSALMIFVSAISVLKLAKRRDHAWLAYAVALAIFLPLLMLAVQYYPYETARPGSDYDIAMKNFFITGLGYSASTGIAALLAMLMVLFCPKKMQTNTAKNR
jgi:4-amino-4-deoxy-L-arabinose transferase-like glycosyltransferase